MSPGAVKDELHEVLFSLVGVYDEDEPVDEFSHALQCGANAIAAGARPELVTASLFHDVARSPLVTEDVGPTAHEAIAARWLEPRFGPEVAWLAGAHVAAKLYLIEHEPSYLGLLSPASVTSAQHQQAEINDALLSNPLWPEALELRRFDDLAKDPDATLADPEELLRVARSVLLAR